jgi:hypothetical protein
MSEEQQLIYRNGFSVRPFAVLVVRVALLGLSAIAALVAACAHFEPSLQTREYACPMHRQVVSHVSGSCPICGMTLQDRSPSAFRAPETQLPSVRPMTTADGPGDTARGRLFGGPLRDDLAPAWIESGDIVVAILYRDLAAALPPDAGASFTPTWSPRTSMALARTAEEPVAWDATSVAVRFRLHDSRSPLAGRTQSESPGWVTLASPPRTVLTIPARAVIASADGPYVWVPLPGGGAEARRLALGEVEPEADLAVVLSGLREGEPVVVHDAFFFDAQLRLAADAPTSVAGR